MDDWFHLGRIDATPCPNGIAAVLALARGSPLPCTPRPEPTDGPRLSFIWNLYRRREIAPCEVLPRYRASKLPADCGSI